MSSWMTSGKARLNARQNRTFEKHAQQRARVMTGNTGNGTEPQRILRERVHPNANYQPEAARGAKRDRSGTIEIISGDLAKAKYSPNNPIRRRGVVATARRIQQPHSLDQHHQWQSHPPHHHGGEYHPHAPPPPYHPHHPEFHYEHHHHHHHQPHPHHHHRYPPHASAEEHPHGYHHSQPQRRDTPHLERSHHYPEYAHYRTAPYFPPTAGRQAMTYDYKNARWVTCPHPPPYEPPDPIKEAQVYPSAHEPLLENYAYPHPSHSVPPRPPFQGRQMPHRYHPHPANEWESTNVRTKHNDDDDYLFYGDPVNLETQGSFEIPDGNENLLDEHSSRQPLFSGTTTQPTMDQHNLHSNHHDDSDWQPPLLPYDPNHHHHHDGYQQMESPDFPEVKYSKSEMEPWQASTTDQQYQIERSNTWSPGGHSTASAAEPRSFTLCRTSSSRGRSRVSRYVPPRLAYSPPRLPEEGLARFQKKRRTMSPPRVSDEGKSAEVAQAASGTKGPLFFNNGVQIHEDGTPFVGSTDASSSAATA